MKVLQDMSINPEKHPLTVLMNEIIVVLSEYLSS